MSWLNVADLHQAIRAQDFKMVNAVVSSGVDVNAPMRGTTPLALAAGLGLQDIVTVLLENGANVNQLSKDHLDRVEPPLFTACRLGNIDILRRLLDARADINKPDWYGQSPLWVAVREKRLDLVQLLLDCGASISSARNWSECPLYLATKYLVHGRRNIARLLVLSGCEPNMADHCGRTPLYWVIRHEDKEMIALLMNAGANLNINCRWVDEPFLPSDVRRDTAFVSWLLFERANPPCLRRLCRTRIRRHLATHKPGSILPYIDQLPLPPRLKEFMALQLN